MHGQLAAVWQALLPGRRQRYLAAARSIIFPPGRYLCALSPPLYASSPAHSSTCPPQYGDIERLEVVDEYAELSRKTARLFSQMSDAVVADFYFKVDDDVGEC